jgi:hypothetical protein
MIIHCVVLSCVAFATFLRNTLTIAYVQILFKATSQFVRFCIIVMVPPSAMWSLFAIITLRLLVWSTGLLYRSTSQATGRS